MVPAQESPGISMPDFFRLWQVGAIVALLSMAGSVIRDRTNRKEDLE
jgi:hypothetical protein